MSDLHPMERPSGRDGVRRALVTAAAELIGRSGVAAVTTRAIAQAAGVNQGLITRYFGSKEALVREVANDVARRLMAEVVDSSAGLEDLLFGGVPEHSRALRVLIRILLEEDTSQGGWVDRDLMRRFLEWLGAQAGAGEGSVAARVFLVASLILGSEIVAPSLGTDLGVPDIDLAELRRQAFTLFLHGFQKR